MLKWVITKHGLERLAYGAAGQMNLTFFLNKLEAEPRAGKSENDEY